MVVAVVVAVTVEGMVAVVAGRAARVTCDLPIRIVLNESMSSDHAVHDVDVHWTVAAVGSQKNCAEVRQNCARIAPELRQNCARIALAWTVAARGALCSSASSPKAMPFVAVITEPWKRKRRRSGVRRRASERAGGGRAPRAAA